MIVLCVLNLDSYNLYVNFSYLCALFFYVYYAFVSFDIVGCQSCKTCDVIHNYDMYLTTQKNV
jgi:hypothetical protein